jgi:hypothetical protein
MNSIKRDRRSQRSCNAVMSILSDVMQQTLNAQRPTSNAELCMHRKRLTMRLGTSKVS